MNLERLRALDAVATHGSVHAAATALHVTASAVSQQLAKLEREVGQPLLRRQGRGVRLTDAGVLLSEHGRRILEHVARAQTELAELSGDVRGRVRVGAFASGARAIAPGALRSLADRFPDLTVELEESEMDQSLESLARGDLDVAVLNDWGTAPLSLPRNVARVELCVDAFDVLVRADHPCARQRDIALADLGSEHWIGWTRDSLVYTWLIRTLRAAGTEPDIAHTAEDHATHVALVQAGLGITMLPRVGRPSLPDDLRALLPHPHLVRHIYAAWDVGAERPALRAVVEALKEAAHAVAPGVPSSCGPRPAS
jgi:DNA-binding transcriptional LysR family regulator